MQDVCTGRVMLLDKSPNWCIQHEYKHRMEHVFSWPELQRFHFTIWPVLMTRITQEWTSAVWALGFVLILWDLIHGIKNGQLTSYQDRLLLHLTIAQWHHSSSSSSYLTNDGSLLQQTEPHHPSSTTSSSRAISRGLQWDFCWNPQ